MKALDALGSLAAVALAAAAAQGQQGAPPQTSESRSALSESPDDLANQVDDLEEKRSRVGPYGPFGPVLQNWNDVWEFVDEASGLNVGFAYTTLFQAATPGSYKGSGEGGAGDLDIFGRWYLMKPGSEVGLVNEGLLGFNWEYRHRIGRLPPSELGNTIGSLWGTTTGFDVQDFSLIQWWWQQSVLDNRVKLRFGKLDLAAIFDVYRFNSANYSYVNEAFSDNPTIPFPENGLGFAGAWYPADEWFLLYGFGDAEGRKTETATTSLNRIEAWFSAVTAGWTGAVGDIGKGLYQVTAWHSEKRSKSERPSATGVSIVAQQEIGENWVPYARYAFSDQAVRDTKQLATVGAVLEKLGKYGDDELGIGIGWGRPHDHRLRDQWAAEIFYRWEFLPNFFVTPHAQIVINPSRNEADDAIGVFGLRGRFSF